MERKYVAQRTWGPEDAEIDAAVGYAALEQHVTHVHGCVLVIRARFKHAESVEYLWRRGGKLLISTSTVIGDNDVIGLENGIQARCDRGYTFWMR